MGFETIIIILQTLGPFTVLVTVYFLVTELKEQNRVARANARQNIADSHQKVALAGMKPILVDIKIKLRNNEELSKEENAVYTPALDTLKRSVEENQHWVAQGETLFLNGDKLRGIDACQSCHYQGARGIDKRTPSIKGQYARYIRQSLRAYKSGARQTDRRLGHVMQKVSRALSEQDIKSLAAYLEQK